jgi:dihydropteroate synthase-like protein
MSRPQIHFVTGKLAEHALRKVLADMAPAADFDATVGVLNITVAALLTTDWVARRLKPPPGTTKIMLPGYCRGELALIEQAAGVPAERGPKDLRALPQFFGQTVPRRYGDYDIEILAEINHAPRWDLSELVAEAGRLRDAGADLIDIGCDPGDTWPDVAQCVRALRDGGHRVSIDSYNPAEIEPAVRAGAELVLSVNHTNRRQAIDWGCEVVVVPDEPGTMNGLAETIELLATHNVPLRIDPVLEPIGFDFAASLQRYFTARREWPDAQMMMGIGNLTELTDADSAPINVLLLAICQELGIRSVLTTQVINWARTSVRECDLARRLVYHAVHERTLPKHVEPRLVMLRDPRPLEFGQEELAVLASQLKDNNVRLFAEQGQLHLMTAGLHVQGTDPFLLFDELLAKQPRNLDASHAFYLGYEMAKAATALALGKEYRQDEALQWGFLTQPELPHRSSAAPPEESSDAAR